LKKANEHAVKNANKKLDELMIDILGNDAATGNPEDYKKKKEEI
jgi:hypothetical protein